MAPEYDLDTYYTSNSPKTPLTKALPPIPSFPMPQRQMGASPYMMMSGPSPSPNTLHNSMAPAPLKIERRNSPPIKRLAPLDSIGAPRDRSRSPSQATKPFSIKPLNDIGALRPRRDVSAPRMPSTPQPQQSAPMLSLPHHPRLRSSSMNNKDRPTPPPSPFGAIASAARNPVISRLHSASLIERRGSELGASKPQNLVPGPGRASPRQPTSRDILLDSSFFDDLQTNPYLEFQQQAAATPIEPEEDEWSPRTAGKDFVLATTAYDGTFTANGTFLAPCSPVLPATQPASPYQAITNVYLDDIMAGPYAQGDSPVSPLKVPQLFPNTRSSTPIDTPDMSEPNSDSEDSCRDSNASQGVRLDIHDILRHDLPRISNGIDGGDSAYETTSPFSSASTCSVNSASEYDGSPKLPETATPSRKGSGRKAVPSMSEYMSMDQLEAMWGKQDSAGLGFSALGFGDFMPVAAPADEPESPTLGHWGSF